MNTRFFKACLNGGAIMLGAAAPFPAVAKIDWKDPATFPPEIFPGIAQKNETDIALAGLSALYPERLTRAAPATPPELPARPPVQASLPGQIHYLRCYDTESLPTPPAGQALIVDLRYLSTTPADIAACLNFSGKIFGAVPRLKVVGKYPLPHLDLKLDDAPPPRIVVLVNRQTSGPLEAILADLQARKKIILVGAATAGATAHYQPLPAADGWWSVVGELQTEENPTSLIGSGVPPQIRVPVPPENDLLSWQWIERGAAPETVLRLTQSSSTSGEKKNASNRPAEENIVGTDLVFQRGYEILAALQVMEDMTASEP